MGGIDQAIADRVAKLTDRQRSCLRYVRDGYETKQIARLLGISPDRAAKDIKAAMGKLHVSRRFDAARILAQAEGAHAGPGLMQALSEPEEPRPIVYPPNAGQHREHVSETRATYVVDRAPIEFSVPFRKRGSEHNDLGLWQRIFWIALITALTLSAFGGLASGLAMLSTSVGSTKL